MRAFWPLLISMNCKGDSENCNGPVWQPVAWGKSGTEIRNGELPQFIQQESGRLNRDPSYWSDADDALTGHHVVCLQDATLLVLSPRDLSWFLVSPTEEEYKEQLCARADTPASNVRREGLVDRKKQHTSGITDVNMILSMTFYSPTALSM